MTKANKVFIKNPDDPMNLGESQNSHARTVAEKKECLKLVYLHMVQYTCTYIHCTCRSVFLISSYGTPLAQRASYLALHSSLFGPDGAVIYDYIVTNSINS